MKTVIAGSRSIQSYQTVKAAIEKTIKENNLVISTVICGCARGVDRLGEQWAKENKIPVLYFPADWENLGKRAGYVRNEQMAAWCDAVIVIWNGYSRGSATMIEIAERENKPIYQVLISS